MTVSTSIIHGQLFWGFQDHPRSDPPGWSTRLSKVTYIRRRPEAESGLDMGDPADFQNKQPWDVERFSSAKIDLDKCYSLLLPWRSTVPSM